MGNWVGLAGRLVALDEQNCAMAADLNPVVAALADLSDSELHALIDATHEVLQIAPGPGRAALWIRTMHRATLSGCKAATLRPTKRHLRQDKSRELTMPKKKGGQDSASIKKGEKAESPKRSKAKKVKEESASGGSLPTTHGRAIEPKGSRVLFSLNLALASRCPTTTIMAWTYYRH